MSKKLSAGATPLTINNLAEVQAGFDAEQFSGADNDDPIAKRRHVSFHIGILAGKMMRVEEQADHGVDQTKVILEEVVPDLLVYAAQLLNLTEGDLDLERIYRDRLEHVAHRNGRHQP